MDPTQNPIQVAVPQPKPNYLLIIISSILGMILLGTIFFLYLQNQKLQKQIINQQTNSTIKVPSPTSIVSSISILPDETANWKTYSSEILSFKYPKEFITDPISSALFSASTTNQKKLSLSLIPEVYGMPCLTKVDTQEFVLDILTASKTFYKFSANKECDPNEANLKTVGIKFNYMNKNYAFFYYYPLQVDTEETVLFDQILSTFKFAENITEEKDN